MNSFTQYFSHIGGLEALQEYTKATEGIPEHKAYNPLRIQEPSSFCFFCNADKPVSL